MTEARIELAIAAGDQDGPSHIRRQYASYPFHICRPHVFAGDPAGMITLYMQSASGGVYEGDRHTLSFTVEAGAQAHVTTQAATVVRSMERDSASITLAVEAGPASHLEFIPDATILFPEARLYSSLRVVADPTASVLISDAFLGHDPQDRQRPFGLMASDLTFARPGAEPCVRDRFVLTGSQFAAGLAGLNGRYAAHATLFAFHPGDKGEAVLRALRAVLDMDGVYAGASPLPSGAGTWCRLLAEDGAALKTATTAAWSAVRWALCGTKPRPRRK